MRAIQLSKQDWRELLKHERDKPVVPAGWFTVSDAAAELGLKRQRTSEKLNEMVREGKLECSKATLPSGKIGNIYRVKP